MTKNLLKILQLYRYETFKGVVLVWISLKQF